MKDNTSPDPDSNGSGVKTFLDGLSHVDEAIAGQTAADPLNVAMAGEAPPIAAAAGAVPDPFFRQFVPQVVQGALELSKAQGWFSPAVPPMLTEEMWVQQVSGAGINTLEKYFPGTSDKFGSEIVLLSLVGPWLVLNVLAMWNRKDEKLESNKKKTGGRFTNQTDEEARAAVAAGVYSGSSAGSSAAASVDPREHGHGEDNLSAAILGR